jgi:hypothetical protein
LFTDLLYTVYENGKAVKPQIIFSINKKNNRIGLIRYRIELDSSNNAIILFVGALEANKPPSLNLMKIKNNKKSEIKKIVDFPADFYSIIDKKGTIHVAFTKGSPGKGKDINSIFYCNFSDDGNTVSEPVLVHKSGLQPATNLRLAIDEKNIIYLVWAKYLSNRLFPQEIHFSFLLNGIWTDSKKIYDVFDLFNLNPNIILCPLDQILFFWNQYDSENITTSILYVNKSEGKKHVLKNNESCLEVIFNCGFLYFLTKDERVFRIEKFKLTL